MRFGVGEVLGTSVRILVKRFVPFLGIVLVYFVPIFVVSWAIPRHLAITWWFLDALLAFLGFLAVAAPITYGVVQDLKGRDFTVLDCLGVAWRRLVPVLFVIVILVLTHRALELFGEAVPIVGGIAYTILIPILFVRWAVAIPAAVMERTGGIGGLSRSAALTKGRRWRVFALGLLLVLVPTLAFSLLVMMTRSPDSAPMDPAVTNVLASVSFALYALFHAVVQATTYYRLRQEKEGGLDTDDLAQVFE